MENLSIDLCRMYKSGLDKCKGCNSVQVKPYDYLALVLICETEQAQEAFPFHVADTWPASGLGLEIML